MKYPKLQGLCKTCLYGCYRLENASFTGVYQCKYYLSKQKQTEVDRKWTQERIKL